MTNRSSEAVAAYTKALELLSDFETSSRKTNCLNNRALAYVVLGQFTEAKQDLLAAIELDGEHNNQVVDLALLHLHLGERAAYAALCERVMREATESTIDSGSQKSVWGGARAVLLCTLSGNALENYEKAIQLLQTKFEKDEKYHEYPSVLGAILFRAGKFDAALTVLAKTEEGISNANKFFFLAMCHQKLSNYDEARNWLERAKAAAAKLLSQPGFNNWRNRTKFELLRDEATNM